MKFFVSYKSCFESVPTSSLSLVSFVLKYIILSMIIKERKSIGNLFQICKKFYKFLLLQSSFHFLWDLHELRADQ